MICGCDRLIVLDRPVDSKFLADDGSLYLDLNKDTTFNQIDSLTELDPLGNFKTESVMGGNLPVTSKNTAILDLAINPKEQNKKLLRVIAMNGHKALNVNSLRVVHSDGEGYEIELIKDDTHWAVCASKLKLNTLELEEVEFTKDTIIESWDNYIYEDGDVGVYFPLAYYGNTYRNKGWIVEDFRPTHSLKQLLIEGFCQCGWDFSSPIFDEIGKQLWVYVLGEDYGKEDLEGSKFKATGLEGVLTTVGGVSGNFDLVRSNFVGISKYHIKLDMKEEVLTTNIAPIIYVNVYRQYNDNGTTRNILLKEFQGSIPVTGRSDNWATLIDEEFEVATVPGDDIVYTFQYRSFQTGMVELSDLTAFKTRYTISNEPIRTIYTRGDTMDLGKIIDPELSLMDILKGSAHLFGQAKLYINNATKEIKLLPPMTTKWEEQTIEGFFKYDEVVTLEDGLICDSITTIAADFSAARHNIIRYKDSNNPYIEEDTHARKVDFDNEFDDQEETFQNPTFKPVINKKLIKEAEPRTPYSWEAISDGIDLMWLVDNEGDKMSYDIGVVPFLAYGSYGNYSEKIKEDYAPFMFQFEDDWYDIPVSGQKANGYYIKDLAYHKPKPYLVYGEYPLEDLFSIFWREYFYKQALGSRVGINVMFSSSQLSQLDYRKLYFIQYGEGFTAWLNSREFNFCSIEGTKLLFTPDISIEPECIDPDTNPPVEPPCDKDNSPEIEWSVDEDCMLSYSQVGTIESTILNDEWLIRYEGETSFTTAPPSPFIPDGNLYLRYKAVTDDEKCPIPVVSVFINVCQVNVLEAEVSYNEGTDCYKIDSLLEGCNTYSDMVFEQRPVDNMMYEIVAVSNPGDPVEDWYVEICAPTVDFCVRVTGTIIEGCEVDPSEVCINLCPKETDIVCDFEEVEDGFQFVPEINIYKPILDSKYEYDLDENFGNPTVFNVGDTLTGVGKIYFRISLTFDDCPTLIKICTYDRNSEDCALNEAGFECFIQQDGRLSFNRTGNLVTETLLDIIRYREIEQDEWQTWDGKPLTRCPVYAQRLVIFCNDCGNICTETKLCNCTIPQPPLSTECDEFNIVVNRFKNLLYATPTMYSNDTIFIFIKDGVEVQNSALNYIVLDENLSSGEYIIKAIFGDCESQDEFYFDSECIVPELELDNQSNVGMDYDFEFTLNNPTNNPNMVVTNTYQTSESETSDENYSVTLIGTDLTFSGTLHYGRNSIKVEVTTECGSDVYEFDVDISCPAADAGLNAYYTICQGCWGELPLFDFLNGTPDAGGTWSDINASGKLDGDELKFDELFPGTYEFMYVINTGSNLCNAFSSVFVEVLTTKEAGESTSTELCHNADETELISLLSGSPESGGEWYTDDVIDGTIDLTNGTIEPAITDIGKTITLAYSFNQPTSELPDGVGGQEECWLEFDGVDDYAEARNSSDLDFDLPIKISFNQIQKNANARIINKYAPYVIGYKPGSLLGFRGNPPSIDMRTYDFSSDYGNDVVYELKMDGADLVQYLDGTEIGRTVSASLPGNSSNKFSIGGYSGAPVNDWFKGKIYNFQIGSEIFPMNEGVGSPIIEGSLGTILDIYGATWGCDESGSDPCDCSTYALLTIKIIDCTPPIPCPDDTGLGVSIAESTNSSPADAAWVDKLTITKTGTYDDAGVIATDDNYFSFDDGDNWVQGDEVKDDDYWAKLTWNWANTCTSYHLKNITLTNGEDANEGTLTTKNGTYNQTKFNITPSDKIEATGSCSAMINERYYRWEVTHILNSGWKLRRHVMMFAASDPSGCSCAPSPVGNSTKIEQPAQSGKMKILVQRRITYNNGCDPIIIEDEFNPTLPDCPEPGAGLGFDITPPYKIGSAEYNGFVRCAGTAPGSWTDNIYLFGSGGGGYYRKTYACGSSNGSNNTLRFNESYFFIRSIGITECPAIALTHNYGAPTSCSTASIKCTKDSGNNRAKAEALSTPGNTASSYYQYKRDSGSWQSYSPGQWINVTVTTTLSFRRIANYNNGCPQTTSSCSTTITPPNYSLSISCSGNTIIVNGTNIPPGGTYLLYRFNTIVGSNTSGANFSISQNGNYKVKYTYNQYQEINSNTINCGTSGGGCTDPTITLGACSVSGSDISVPFTTTEIDHISKISASVNPGSGNFNWNPSTGKGILYVTGTPGTSYVFSVTVTNDCGSDTDSTTCEVGCSTLSFDQQPCDFPNDRVTYDILVSPDTGVVPTSNGTYLSKVSTGRYRFRYYATSGTLTASHPSQCTSISQVISCQCPPPIVNFNISCDNTKVAWSFTVTNPDSITGPFRLKIGNTTRVILNVGLSSYSGTYNDAGLTHAYDFYYTACGTEVHNTGNINCSCIEPSIALTASCTGTTINYSFTVNNESQANSGYSLLINGTSVATIPKTGAGTYTGTRTVTAGSNNTVQVKVGSVCGGQKSSSIVNANCACPPASLSISNVSCASTTQVLTFNINQTNVSGLVLKVNGVTKTVSANPQVLQGVSGSNTILVTGKDSCSAANLSDTVNYNCGCDQPSIALTGSCNSSGLVSFSFTVTDESRVDSNYKLFVGGSQVKTVTKTSAGTYNSTWQGSPGTNYSLRIEADNKCGGVTKSNTKTTSCGCPSSSLSITGVSCNSTTQMLTFTVNQTNVTGIVLKVNGVTKTLGSNPQSFQGIIGSNLIAVTGTDSCTGGSLSDQATTTCDCGLPSIVVSASCNTSGVVSYSFTVTDESRVQGNYAILINGTQAATKTNTSAGTYTGTYNGSPGSNYTVQIKADNKCNGSTSSNTIGTNCGCPPSTLSISNVSCNSTTQKISFNLTRTNVSNVVLKYKGNTISPIPSNPIVVQGIIGTNNSITVTGKDSCTGAALSDSKTSINCGCTPLPTVTSLTPSLSGSTLTIAVVTTNIANTSDFDEAKGNGNTISTITKTSTNNFKFSFPVQTGTNNFSVKVSNNCGTATKSGTYSHNPCVNPTITKISETNVAGGNFFIRFAMTGCTSISATPAHNPLTCSSTGVVFAHNGSNTSWSVTVTNSCGTATISGVYKPCDGCSASIQSLGCSSTPKDIDFIFLVDGSASILNSKFAAIQESVRLTIGSINSSGAGSYRYAVAGFDDRYSGNDLRFITQKRSGNYFNTYSNTVSDIAENTWIRKNSETCANWDRMWLGLNGNMGSGLNRRSGKELHVIILHDSDDNTCSEMGNFSMRNSFLANTNNVKISVVRYEFPAGGQYNTGANAKSAAMATSGGNWGDGSVDDECETYPYCIEQNTGSPDGHGSPRRMYYRKNIFAAPISNLISDALETCQLKAASNCGAVSYTWTVVSGGGVISAGHGSSIITTNGQGKYQVSIVDEVGCTKTSQYDYSMNYTKIMVNDPALVMPAAPEIPDPLNFSYDYSKLKEADIGKLHGLYKEEDWKKVQIFYNKKVTSEYFFSCGCDNEKLKIIVEEYLDGLGLL